MSTSSRKPVLKGLSLSFSTGFSQPKKLLWNLVAMKASRHTVSDPKVS
jgi:hypothetical protein